PVCSRPLSTYTPTPATYPLSLHDALPIWTDLGFGDLLDKHDYPGPGMFPAQGGRASVLGEFGGLGLPIEGHLWQQDKNWGYRSIDRKSTRLNSSHQIISYAVFCLKKKKLK